MLRIYFVQQWYGLADEAVEDALYDSRALRGFAGIELDRDPIPDATTVLHFRHWLERHDLAQGLFDEVGAMLEERGLPMRQSLPRRRPGGGLSTPRSSPPRPRPRTSRRRAIRRCTRAEKATSGTSASGTSASGTGMQAHVGVDVASGLGHTVVGTAANEADITQTVALLHGEEKDVFGDAG